MPVNAMRGTVPRYDRGCSPRARAAARTDLCRDPPPGAQWTFRAYRRGSTPRPGRTPTMADEPTLYEHDIDVYGWVVELQRLLSDRGHPSPDPSGEFGAVTKQAVIAFQRANAC